MPTGRSYQSYLQLVPGVLPDDPEAAGNPASKSGLHYRDIGGDAGVSRDNFYYIDGINVTDGVTGTFGANLNTEIIQEQQVLTGGIPAEYVGAPGLLSSVVTKSGANQLSGSVNYFFQNDGRRSPAGNRSSRTRRGSSELPAPGTQVPSRKPKASGAVRPNPSGNCIWNVPRPSHHPHNRLPMSDFCKIRASHRTPCSNRRPRPGVPPSGFPSLRSRRL